MTGFFQSINNYNASILGQREALIVSSVPNMVKDAYWYHSVAP
jgi:hypothetical protein